MLEEARLAIDLASQTYVEERKRLAYDDPDFKRKVAIILNKYADAIRPYFSILEQL